MKRKVVSLLLTAAMVLTVFAGCGKEQGAKNPDNDKVNDPSGNPDDTQVEVNPDVKGTVTVGINAHRNSDFEAISEAFKKQYPNVVVKPVLFESNSDDATEYLTSMKMAGKIMPDVIYDDAGSMPTYIQNGWMYPLTDLVEGDEAYAKVPKSITDRMTYNGNIYALGQTLHSNVLVVNEDLVEEMNVDLPEYDWTWEDFTEFIKACTNATYSGVEDLSGQYNWMPGAMTEGRSIVGYDYETNTFDLEAVRKYVNYYFEIAKLNGVEATSLKQNSSAGTSDYVKKFGDVSGTDAAFIAGKVAGTFAGTWTYANWNQKELDFNWEFYPIPQCVAGRIPIHVDYCWMTTDIAEENLEAAWAFLRFVTYSKEGNIARLTTYDEDHITSDMNNAYFIPCTADEAVSEKFKSLPYVTDAIIYIYENYENGYLGDPEKFVPGFEAVEYPIIGKLAFESVTGRDDFSSKMMDAQTKANAEIANYKDIFDEALAKFETEFAASH